MMNESTFLGKLAEQILSDHASLADVTIVLPSRRARLFLLKELQVRISDNIFAPTVLTVEDLVVDMANLRKADPIETLFELYEVYMALTPNEHLQEFEQFANWGRLILQDFNEIDRFLIDPRQILNHLTAIERIKQWSPDNQNPTELITRYLTFWSQLPAYYEALYTGLKSKGMAYQGMMYREAISNLEFFAQANQHRMFVFAGLNALNKAEEQIIKHLLAQDQAKIYWDIDERFLKDHMHDAGLFLRRFKAEWQYFKQNPFEWVTNSFSQEKEIEVIGTPKAIGQAKIVGQKVEELIQAHGTAVLNKTAIVLGDEKLLLPVLHALPKSVGALNITMGYPSKQSPAQILVAKICKLHSNTLNRKSAGYVMYYKDLLEVLSHPLVWPYIHGETVSTLIRKENYSFIAYDKLVSLAGENTALFQAIIKPWQDNSSEALNNLLQVLLLIKDNLRTGEDDAIAKAFLYEVFKVINKLKSFSDRYLGIANVATIYAMYKQIIELAEVAFEGEPLHGLQIMGVLESRALDFEHVIITSLNEGCFPAGKSNQSFIPFDVKLAFQLPTYKEKDAVYTYHFYRLLMRARQVTLLYNTDAEGLTAGEKSRFITQLEVEQYAKVTTVMYNPSVPKVANEPIIVVKSDEVMDQLKDLMKKGLFPTNLTLYIRNPLHFYFRKILNIKEVEDVQENIALHTLGTIIHETLKALYTPYINHLIKQADVQAMINKADDEVLRQFGAIYRMGEIRTGKNLLAFEVAKRNIRNFLNLEMESIKKGDNIEIIALEQTYARQIEHSELPIPISLKGNIDRIDRRNGVLRIIDYKTGRVDSSAMQLKDWSTIMRDIKYEKQVQVLAYGLICQEHYPNTPMEAGIISFKNLSAGFMPFYIKDGKENKKLLSHHIFSLYLDEMVSLIKEILDQSIPFAEKETM